MPAFQQGDSPPDPGQIQRFGNMPGPRGLQRRAHPGIPDAVFIHLPARIITGMETDRRFFGFKHGHRLWQHAIQCPHQIRNRHQTLCIKIHDLMPGMNASIGAAAGCLDDGTAVQYAAQCLFKLRLNRMMAWLLLKTKEGGPIILQNQTDVAGPGWKTGCLSCGRLRRGWV